MVDMIHRLLIDILFQLNKFVVILNPKDYNGKKGDMS